MKTRNLPGFALLVSWVFLLGTPIYLMACGPAVVDTLYFGKVTGFPSDEITAITSDRTGNIIVGTKDRGLVTIPAGKEAWARIVDESQSLSFNAIHSLHLDQDNRLWVGTAGGLNYLDGPTVQMQSKYFAEDGMKDNIVLSIVRDPNGSKLFIGTTMGMVIKEAWFQRYTEKDGLVSNIVQSLTMDGDGDIWIGTSNGLMTKKGIQGYQKVELSSSEKAVSDWVYGLATLPRGEGSTKEKKQNFQELVVQSLDAMLRGIERRPEGEGVAALKKSLRESIAAAKQRMAVPPIFAATNTGVYSLEKANLTASCLHEGWFTAITMDSLGRAFAANNQLNVVAVGIGSEIFPGFEVGKMIKETLIARIKKELLESEDENSMLTIDREQLQKMRQLNDEELELWVQKTVLSKNISAIHADIDGNIWIGLEQGGLFKFHPETVNQDAFFYGLKYNQEAGGDAVGYPITTPKGPYPLFEQILTGIAQYSDEKNVWVGKWSQLLPVDAVTVMEFVGEWSHPACVQHLVKLLPFDPYVVIPMNPDTAPVVPEPTPANPAETDGVPDSESSPGTTSGFPVPPAAGSPSAE